MTDRERLHILVDELPEADLEVAERLVRGLSLTRPGGEQSGLRAFLAICPADDEEETEEERDEVAQAWDEYRRGETIAHEDLSRRNEARAA